MAYNTYAKTVTTTATQLSGTIALTSRIGYAIQNVGSVTVWIGGPSVTVDTGYPIAPGEIEKWNQFNGPANEDLYGIVAWASGFVRCEEAS